MPTYRVSTLFSKCETANGNFEQAVKIYNTGIWEYLICGHGVECIQGDLSKNEKNVNKIWWVEMDVWNILKWALLTK